METQCLLKEHVINIPLECPICYETRVLDHTCPHCRWQSCIICHTSWAATANTCPQCRAELGELDEKKDEVEEEEEITCSLFKLIFVKVISFCFMFYLVAILIAVHNGAVECNDDPLCMFVNILLDILIVCLFCNFGKKVCN